jgi:hypothetical protein
MRKYFGYILKQHQIKFFNLTSILKLVKLKETSIYYSNSTKINTLNTRKLFGLPVKGREEPVFLEKTVTENNYYSL